PPRRQPPGAAPRRRPPRPPAAAPPPDAGIFSYRSLLWVCSFSISSYLYAEGWGNSYNPAGIRLLLWPTLQSRRNMPSRPPAALHFFRRLFIILLNGPASPASFFHETEGEG